MTSGPWEWIDYPDGRKLLAGVEAAVIHCPDAPMAVDPSDAVAIAAVPDLLAALKKAKQFIAYARYELDPGKAVFGDQFPKQEDADIVTALIDSALAKAEPLAEGSPREGETLR